MEHVHTEKVGALDVVIDYDDDPLNPRAEFDHVGTMVCAHSRYTLGDVQVNNVDEVLDYILQEDGVWVSDGGRPQGRVEWLQLGVGGRPERVAASSWETVCSRCCHSASVSLETIS